VFCLSPPVSNPAYEKQRLILCKDIVESCKSTYKAHAVWIVEATFAVVLAAISPGVVIVTRFKRKKQIDEEWCLLGCYAVWLL
jgi:hypothetical protein